MAFVRTLAKDVAFYGVLDALQRAVSVLLVPIYTRVLSQREFGSFDLIFATVGLVQVLVDLQQSQGFLRFYPEQRAAGHGPRFTGTHLTTRIGLGVMASVVFIALGESRMLEAGFIPSYDEWRLPWIIAVGSIPAVLVGELLLLQARLLGDRRLFALAALGNVVLSTGLCVLLVAGLDWGLLGAVVGQSVGNIVAAIVLAAGLRAHMAVAFDRAVLRRMLIHVLPIVPGYWVASFSSHIARFFVFGEMGAANAAILAICIKVVSLIGLFSLSFRMAWQPIAVSHIGHEQSGHQFAESMRVFLIGGIVSLGAFAVLSGWVVVLLAPASYAEASQYLAPLALAAIIAEIEMTLQLGNQVAGRTHWLSISAIAGITLNVALLAWLMPTMGIAAAVMAALGASLLRVVIAYASAQRNYPVRYDWAAFARFGAGAVMIVWLSSLRDVVPMPLLAAAIAAVCLGLAWLSLRPHERRIALGLVGRLRKHA